MDFNIQKHIIFEVTAGSRAYGTATEDSDLDTRGVIIPPWDYFLGLRKFEHYQPTPGEGVLGHMDVCYYDIRKFVNLALAGNPNVLELFKAPLTSRSPTPSGLELRAMWPHIISKKLIGAHVGMAKSHLAKMSRPGRKCGTKGKACIEKYGYNTKDACHVIRVLEQANEILMTGELTLPRPNADLLLKIKNGEYSIEYVQETAEFFIECIRKFERGETPTPLRPKPDFNLVSEMVADCVSDELARQ